MWLLAAEMQYEVRIRWDKGLQSKSRVSTLGKKRVCRQCAAQLKDGEAEDAEPYGPTPQKDNSCFHVSYAIILIHDMMQSIEYAFVVCQSVCGPSLAARFTLLRNGGIICVRLGPGCRGHGHVFWGAFGNVPSGVWIDYCPM